MHSPSVIVFQDDPQMLLETLAEFQRTGFAADGKYRLDDFMSAIDAQRFGVVLVNVANIDTNTVTMLRSCRLKLPEALLFVCSDVPYPSEIVALTGDSRLRILTRPIAMADIAKVIKAHLGDGEKLNYSAGLYRAIEESLEEVVQFYIPDRMARSSPNLKQDSHIHAYISSTMNMSGPHHFGSMLINFEHGLILRFAEAMMGVDPNTVEQAMLVDIAGEICNQLSCVLSSKLDALGLSAAIGLPTPFIAGNTLFVHPGANAVGVIEFSFATNAPPANAGGHLSSVEICFDNVA